MSRKKKARFGTLAEGANYTSARGHDYLIELWKALSGLCGVGADRVDVYGFHKGQIEFMSERVEFTPIGAAPLDAAIAMAHDDRPFDVLIVAVDALPQNSRVREEGCLVEMRWMFERFVARAVLPRKFLDDSRDLLDHYAVEDSREPRRRDYFPRVDAIFMEPEFEALIVCDEGLVRRALEVGKRPGPWPNFKKQPPKLVLDKAVEAAGQDVRRRVRGDIKSNRHGWALEVIKNARSSQRFQSHGIMTRLHRVLGR